MLVPSHEAVSLSVALVFVVPVAAAVVGGLWPALGAVVATELAVRFFFIPPYHTFVVEKPGG